MPKWTLEGKEVADDDPSGVLDTPPNIPAPRPSADEAMAAYQAQLLEQARENSRLRAELDKKNATPAAPMTPEREKEFFDRPHTTVAEIVREELKKQVGGLNEYVAQNQRANLIANYKQQMRSKPDQFPYIGQIEHLFDQIMSTATVIDNGVVVTAYNAALGHYISGGGSLAMRSDNPPPTPSPVPPTTPPRIPPAPPAVPPRNNDSKPKRKLNENERKIARFRNMSDEEYIAWTDDVRPNEVAHLTDEQIKERMK